MLIQHRIEGSLCFETGRPSLRLQLLPLLLLLPPHHHLLLLLPLLPLVVVVVSREPAVGRGHITRKNPRRPAPLCLRRLVRKPPSCLPALGDLVLSRRLRGSGRLRQEREG